MTSLACRHAVSPSASLSASLHVLRFKRQSRRFNNHSFRDFLVLLQQSPVGMVERLRPPY
jgi:hypothetical protein